MITLSDWNNIRSTKNLHNSIAALKGIEIDNELLFIVRGNSMLIRHFCFKKKNVLLFITLID